MQGAGWAVEQDSRAGPRWSPLRPAPQGALGCALHKGVNPALDLHVSLVVGCGCEAVRPCRLLWGRAVLQSKEQVTLLVPGDG